MLRLFLKLGTSLIIFFILEKDRNVIVVADSREMSSTQVNDLAVKILLSHRNIALLCVMCTHDWK